MGRGGVHFRLRGKPGERRWHVGVGGDVDVVEAGKLSRGLAFLGRTKKHIERTYFFLESGVMIYGCLWIFIDIYGYLRVCIYIYMYIYIYIMVNYK